MRAILLLLTLPLFIMSCSKDIDRLIDYSDFTALNDSSHLTTLSVAPGYGYYAYRSAWCSNEGYIIHFEQGEKCFPEMDALTCRDQIDSAFSEQGFHYGCLPGCCMNYFISRSGNQVQFHTDRASVIELLQPIDTPSDALMIAITEGYDFRTNDSTASGVREIRDGYQLIMLKLVGYCDPVQTDRFLLEVNREGELKVIASEVFSSAEGLCI